MAPRRTDRVRKPSQRVMGSPGATSQAATAAAGLLALGSGTRRVHFQPRPPRRRGSSTKASESGGGGGSRGGPAEQDEDDEMDTESSIEHDESNNRYRRQRGLPRENSNIPDLQASTQPEPDSEFDFDIDEPLVRNLQHFDFQVKAMVKKQAISEDRCNTKDWSYQTYIMTEASRLETGFAKPGESVNPPRLASEMKIRAHGMNQPIKVPIRVDSDLERCLRAVHNVRHRQKRKGLRVELTIPFELVTIQPTPLTATPYVSPPLRQTSSVRRRRDAAERAAIAEITGDRHAQIAATHSCPDTLCANYPEPCVVSQDHGYLPLTTTVIEDWCTWIRGGTATVERPPPSLIIRPAKEAGKRTATAHALLNPELESTSPGVNLYISAGSEAGQIRYQAQSSLSCDDDAKMEAYCDWLIKGRLGNRNALERAKSALETEGWGFSDLRDITNEQWKHMGIPGGIQKKLMKHWKKYSRLLEAGRP